MIEQCLLGKSTAFKKILLRVFAENFGKTVTMNAPTHVSRSPAGDTLIKSTFCSVFSVPYYVPDFWGRVKVSNTIYCACPEKHNNIWWILYIPTVF